MHAQNDERIGGPPATRRSIARIALFLVLAAGVVLALGLIARELLRATPTQGVQIPGGSSGSAAQARARSPGASAGASAPETSLVQSATTGAGALPPLPALAESDPQARVALASILPAPAHPALAPDDLLRRAAAVTDAFARGKFVRDKLPLPAAPGKLIVVERGGRIYLDPANFARYDLLAKSLAGTDVDALAAWFLHWEPLFQQAYGELGNGETRVRDAIVAGIALMLAAPSPQAEPELKQPAVFYKFADPALESLPDTQKLMIRMGPANRERVAGTLTRLREALGS